ncbi:MAG: efflux RND transporter periplasmic adaptor subunit [Polyangia bacterium]
MTKHHAYALGLLATLCLTACHSASEKQEASGVFEITNPVRKDTESTREYVCQIRAIQHIELRALESGYLQSIFVDEGQFVHRGERMFQILPSIYQADLQKAAAETSFAQIEYDNTKKLADGKVVSPNELALAKAKLQKAQAEQSLAKVHLGFTEIKAPFDGIMDRLRVRRGSLVDEGDLLSTLSDNSKMWVYFNVNESEYLDYKAQAAKGSVPTVQLVMANGKTFEHIGKVETIEADFNNETGTIAFRATFPNAEGLLRHGETGKVIMTTPLKDALLIPQKATYEIMDKKYVFVVGKDGVAHARQIVIGTELPHVFVIDRGLTVKDEILLDGLRKVRDGEKIETKHVDPNEVMAHLQSEAS